MAGKTTKRTTTTNNKAKVTGAVAKIHAIEAEAAAHLYEREDVLHALSLCMIARVNAFFLGEPGTAKTLAVNVVADSFCPNPNDFFSVLMTKTTNPNELFGPPDVQGLMNGQQRRLVEGFLPTAKAAAIDEIWKGSAAILNTLLTIANERRFRNGSAGWVDCPLRFIVGMSNEFPEEPTLLAAMYDRFPIKLVVNPIQDDANFTAMLANGHATVTTRLTDEDLAELDALVAQCQMPHDVLQTVAAVRGELARKHVRISDRRWYQAVRVMKAEAVYHGRATVTTADLRVLEWIAWNTDEERGVIPTVLQEYMDVTDRQIRDLLEEAASEAGKVRTAYNADGKTDSGRKANDSAAAASAAMNAGQRLNKIAGALMALAEDIDSDEAKDKAFDALARVEQFMAVVRRIGMGVRKGGADAMGDLSKMIGD